MKEHTSQEQASRAQEHEAERPSAPAEQPEQAVPEQVPAFSEPAAPSFAGAPAEETQNSPAQETPGVSAPDFVLVDSTAEENAYPDFSAQGTPASGTVTAHEEANGSSDASLAAPGEPTPQQSPQPAARPSFFAAHPVEQSECPVPPSFLSRVFGAFGYVPWLFLFVLLAALIFPSLLPRAPQFGEPALLATVNEFIASSSWLPALPNGLFMDAPLYVVVLKALHLLPVPAPVHLPLLAMGAGCSAVLFLLAFLAYGRIVARAEGKVLLAGGLMVLCSGLALFSLHYEGRDLLFASLVVLSSLCFYLAAAKRRSILFTLLGYLAGVAAFLAGGPLGLLLPLSVTLLFSLWRGCPLLLVRPASLLGLVLACGSLAAFAGASFVTENVPWLDALNRLAVQVPVWANSFFAHDLFWYEKLALLALGLLPWSVLLVCLPWTRVLTPSFWSGVLATRTTEKEGIAWLFVTASVCVLYYMLTNAPLALTLLPALPALGLLAARALFSLRPFAAGAVRYTYVLFLLVCSVLLFGVVAYNILPMPELGTFPMKAVAASIIFVILMGERIVAAVVLYFGLQSNRVEGVLLVLALLCIATVFPMVTSIVPHVNGVLAPAPQAEVLHKAIAAEYAPAAYKTDGTLFMGNGLPRLAEARSLEEIAAVTHAQQKVVLLARAAHAAEVEAMPGFVAMHRQWIGPFEYIVFARPPLALHAPAAPEQQESAPAGADPVPAPSSSGDRVLSPAVNGTVPERAAPESTPASNSTQPVESGEAPAEVPAPADEDRTEQPAPAVPGTPAQQLQI